MNSVDVNKQYVRDNINPSEQESFYDFFIHLEDHDQFQHWNLPRVMQAVSLFKAQQSLKNSKVIVKPQIKKGKNAMINTPTKNIAVSQLLQIIQKKEQSRFSPKQVKSNQKLYTSLNLLDQIENEKAIKIMEELTDKNGNLLFGKSEEWLKETNRKINGRSQPRKDIFQSFDAFIKQNNPQQNITLPYPPDKKPQFKDNSGGSPTKQTNDKTNKQKCQQSNQNSIGQKIAEGIKLKDKLFKWKLTSKIKCLRNEAITNCQNLAIVSHEMVHRIFLPDYAIYCIKTFPSNLQTKRTYDDFIQLRDILQKMFPGVKIPYLQNKSWLAESDITLINKNKIHLQYFLRGILEHPILSTSSIFKDFLVIQSHKMIKKKNEQYENLPPISSLSTLSTQKGYTQVVLSQQQHRVIEELPKWQGFIDIYFEKCIELIGNLVAQYEAIIQTFTQLSTLSSEMSTQSWNLSLIRQNHEQFIQFFTRQDTYYDKCRKQMEMDALHLKDKILPFLKYEKTNINYFTPLIDKVTDLTSEYIKKMQNEPESPSSSSQQHSKDKLNDIYFPEGLWQQSDNLAAFKYQVGYLSHQLVDQSKHFSKRLMSNMNRVWKQLIDKSHPNKQNALMISKKNSF